MVSRPYAVVGLGRDGFNAVGVPDDQVSIGSIYFLIVLHAIKDILGKMANKIASVFLVNS